MKPLDELLAESAARHPHLCPRQVLGVRMGMLAGKQLDLDIPQADKRLVVIVETYGCVTDGIAVATNCWVGRRTMQIEDYGKVAATFADTETGKALRIIPHPDARNLAARYAPQSAGHWQAMLLGYQRMPDRELLCTKDVELVTNLDQLLSRPGPRAMCSACGEEIMNGREVHRGDAVFCLGCEGRAYYRPSL